ncbi:unnamed protein product [Ectocarpus sp. 12 AP-2014]
MYDRGGQSIHARLLSVRLGCLGRNSRTSVYRCNSVTAATVNSLGTAKHQGGGVYRNMKLRYSLMTPWDPQHRQLSRGRASNDSNINPSTTIDGARFVATLHPGKCWLSLPCPLGGASHPSPEGKSGVLCHDDESPSHDDRKHRRYRQQRKKLAFPFTRSCRATHSPARMEKPSYYYRTETTTRGEPTRPPDNARDKFSRQPHETTPTPPPPDKHQP